MTYAESGVSILNGEAFVSQITPVAKETLRPGCVSSLGGFGGLFDLNAAGYKNPILVSGTDGVGTKLMVDGLLLTYNYSQKFTLICVWTIF